MIGFVENKGVCLSLESIHICPDCSGVLYQYQEQISACTIRNQGRADAYVVTITGPPLTINEYVCFACGWYYSDTPAFRLHPEQFTNMLRLNPDWIKGEILEALFKNTKRVYPT